MSASALRDTRRVGRPHPLHALVVAGGEGRVELEVARQDRHLVVHGPGRQLIAQLRRQRVVLQPRKARRAGTIRRYKM